MQSIIEDKVFFLQCCDHNLGSPELFGNQAKNKLFSLSRGYYEIKWRSVSYMDDWKSIGRNRAKTKHECHFG